MNNAGLLLGELVLAIGGQCFAVYSLLSQNRNQEITLNWLILRENNYDNTRLQHNMSVNESLLNPDQSSVNSSVLDIYSNTGDIISFDALSLTSKNFYA